jgi:hypothetical protein
MEPSVFNIDCGRFNNEPATFNLECLGCSIEPAGFNPELSGCNIELTGFGIAYCGFSIKLRACDITREGGNKKSRAPLRNTGRIIFFKIVFRETLCVYSLRVSEVVQKNVILKSDMIKNLVMQYC